MRTGVAIVAASSRRAEERIRAGAVLIADVLRAGIAIVAAGVQAIAVGRIGARSVRIADI